ncbi:Nuclear pore complex protein Nup133 [Nymphon striatum]|nr:Nuclear pore complex protein Nup133 [Nymphon striatum]
MYTPQVSRLAGGRAQKSSLKKNHPLLNISKRSTNASFNSSFQTSHIFEETGNHVVEGYGVSLPVLVAEALDRSSCTSVKISENGWCWLVSGRRLFIWKYKIPQGSKSVSSYCKELTLPSSDLAHKAELVSVHAVKSDSSVMVQPVAIAVSPEGLVRYWPSITHDGSYFETSVDLHGQECFSLTDVQPFGCILATTTSSLVLISTKYVSGHNNIQCHNLRAPQGMLAGIGRKVSSFIFGSIPSQTNECKLAKVLGCDGSDQSEKKLFVLSGPNLQKWNLFDYQSEQVSYNILLVTLKFVYECDLDRIAKETSAAAFWGQDASHCNEIKTWLIDMQLTKNGLIVLIAALNLSMSQMVHFALGYIDRNDDSPPVSFSQFNVLKYSMLFNDADDLIQKYNLIYPSFDSQSVFLYQDKMILCVTGVDEPDKIEFRSPSDRIIGAGSCDRQPLFFISSKGIVSIVSSQPDADMSTAMNESFLPEPPVNLNISTLNMSLMKMDKEPTGDSNRTCKLKTALLHYIKHDLKQCEEIINDCFSPSGIEAEVDSNLDTAVFYLSIEMIDDFPASDPRWVESHAKDTPGSSGSLIILHYLEGKQDAHKYFMTFLKGTDLYDKVKSKIITSRVLDAAIKKVLEDRKVNLGKLTPQDHFYRQVSNMDDIVGAMIDVEIQTINSDIPIQEIITTFSTANKIIQEMFQAVLKFRKNKITGSFSPLNYEQETKSTTWINSEGNNGMRTHLVKQYLMTVEHAVKCAEDVQTKGLLFQQMVDIADIILNGYVSQLEYVKNNTEKFNRLNLQYTDDRYRIIIPFLELEQLDRAAALAEKYFDFKILVELCDMNNNQERLQRYMTQFAAEGFTDFVFKWYLDEGKRGKLLKQPISHTSDLSKFLSIHPDLSWVHHLQTENYGKAHEILSELADNESEYLSRKKTSLSISKLASLVSEESDDIKESQIEGIDNCHNLILYQETLPKPILESFGMDPDLMRVLSPQELIKMYVSEENSSANEYDFKKALDLLQYIDPVSCMISIHEIEISYYDGLDLLKKKDHHICVSILQRCFEKVYISFSFMFIFLFLVCMVASGFVFYLLHSNE